MGNAESPCSPALLARDLAVNRINLLEKSGEPGVDKTYSVIRIGKDEGIHVACALLTCAGDLERSDVTGTTTGLNDDEIGSITNFGDVRRQAHDLDHFSIFLSLVPFTTTFPSNDCFFNFGGRTTWTVIFLFSFCFASVCTNFEFQPSLVK